MPSPASAAVATGLLALAAPFASPAQARGPCSTTMFEGSRFMVCIARPGTARLRLADVGADGRPLRSFAALGRSLSPQSVSFAMNGGMFDREGRSIGLYIEDGRTLKPLNRTAADGNFGMQPNGVFYGDRDGWHVAATSTFAAHEHRAVQFATQSGPMLVIEGMIHPKIASDGPSRLMRNGVGVSASGAAFFVISEEPISFGRFARLFGARLGCRNALYLDGTVSSLWDPASGRRDDHALLGPLVVALAAR